jgi:carbamate kinase
MEHGEPEALAQVGQLSIAVAGADALDPARFEAGSLRPDFEATAEFARNNGNVAAIGRVEDAMSQLSGLSAPE